MGSDDRWVKARNASAALSRMALMCGNSTALYGSMLTIVAAMADDAPPMLKPMVRCCGDCFGLTWPKRQRG